MAKVTIKEILSPALRKKLDELNAVFEEKLAKAIRDAGLKEGQYERLDMSCKINYKPREKGKYPTSSSNFGVILIVWKKRKLWTCWAPIANMNINEFKPVTGDSRESAIMDFMERYMMYGMRNHRKNNKDFEKWNKKYGSGKSKKDAV